MQKRKSLKLIISSATVDAEQHRNYFNLNTTADTSKDTSVALSVKGRTYPVDVFYVQGREDNWSFFVRVNLSKIFKGDI